MEKIKHEVIIHFFPLIHIQYSYTHGAIYMLQVNSTQINNCSFSSNDVLPVMNDIQEIGMIDYARGKDGNVQRANSIFVDKEIQSLEIKNSEFYGNHGEYLLNHIIKVNRDLYDFFPPDYFKSSFS